MVAENDQDIYRPRRPLLSVGREAKTTENNAGLRWSFVGLDSLQFGVDVS